MRQPISRSRSPAETGGARNFTKGGVSSGTLILKGTNTYTGTTTINAGTLLVGSTGLGAGAVTVVSGATLGPESGATISRAISINGIGVGNFGEGALRGSPAQALQKTERAGNPWGMAASERLALSSCV